MNNFFKMIEAREGPAKPGDKPSQELQDMEQLWNAARCDVPPAPDPKDMWLDLSARINQAEQQPSVPLWRQLLQGPTAAGFLAVAVLVLGILLGYHLLTRPLVFETQPGEQRTLHLPDGSVVDLNSGSRLRYSRNFGTDHRQLELLGEAYFSVEKGAVPFVVNTTVGQTTVLGTKFNVFARQEQLRVGVNEGRVEVSANVAGTRRMVLLHAGEKTSCRAGGFPNEPSGISLPLGKFPAWTRNGMYFEQESLANVCKEIERRFNTKVVLADPAFKRLEVSGLLEGKDAKTHIATLCVLIQRQYRFTDGVYTIY